MVILLILAILFTVAAVLVGLLILLAAGMASSPVGNAQLLQNLWPAWSLAVLAALIWICWAKT